VNRGLYPGDKYIAQKTTPKGDISIIKFVPRYGRHVHEFLANIGGAPRVLRYDSETYHDFIMIEMECFRNDRITLSDYFQKFPNKGDDALTTVFENLASLVARLHDNGMVHGDLREDNIVVDTRDFSVVLLDFDWSGLEGTARYPFQLNLDIDWEAPVKLGGLVQKKHNCTF
jgi:serine/threonine protein kinase